MKEDILEQLVDEYLQHQGYFTRHNIKFRPESNRSDYDSRKDSGYSDIDVIGINPKLKGFDRVMVVSCKSWQNGFNPEKEVSNIKNNKTVSGRKAWKAFRELTNQKWSESFIKTVEDISGGRSFTYVTAVTSLKGKSGCEVWETYKPFLENLKNNKIKILTLEDMLNALYPKIKKTPASSSIGRTLQLIKASGWIKNESFSDN